MSHPPQARLFGAALDYLDDAERVGLKLAYTKALADDVLPPGLPLDPYDAVAPLVRSIMNGRTALDGKIDIPGWLTPRPGPDDASLIVPSRYRDFMDAGGALVTARSCAKAASGCLPDVPVMIAVDHCLSAGPISALSSLHGADSLAVVVLDSHFDAVPPEVRIGESCDWGGGHCGDFLAYLMEDGIISPERLFVVGAGDRPDKTDDAGEFGRLYHAWIDKGVKVYNRSECREDAFPDRLAKDIESSGARHLYVSLDADVGSCASMNAVRFLDGVGLSEEIILNIGRALGSLCAAGRLELAGADVCEIDVHLLGLLDQNGREDRTAQICAGFLASLFGA